MPSTQGALGRTLSAVVLALFVTGMAGCGESPVEVVVEVIEDTQFAASLNVDLVAMERLGNGVYIQDLAVGAGEQVVYGAVVSIEYSMWLTDGRQVQSGEDQFLMGNNEVVSGLEDGILAQRTGGTRRLIVPPNHGYGNQDLLKSDGTVEVPAGSVLVFEVTILEVSQPAL